MTLRHVFVISALATVSLYGQEEHVNHDMVERIRNEAFQRSQVMDILSVLTDVHGPRLTGSPGYMRAATWAAAKLQSWNMKNVHLEGWGPWGQGWTLKRYSAHVLGEQPWPLFSFPRAWTPGTDGTISGDVVWFPENSDSARAAMMGKLKGKFVLVHPLRDVDAHWTPGAVRESDSSLLVLANATPAEAATQQDAPPSPQVATTIINNLKKWKQIHDEGALGLLYTSPNDGGIMQFVQNAYIPFDPRLPAPERLPVTPIPAYSRHAPPILPQVVLGIEHYQRLVRMLRKGERPKVEMRLDVEFSMADSSYNVLAEIPGTDLRDEVVMIGAHLDSWHTATGTTDNATGVAVCMEAMRILQALSVQPRRTIRIALWSGEEQGEFGSHAYVRAHFGERDRSTGSIRYKSEAEKFSVYFNVDNGTGAFRGVYMEGMESVQPIFRRWLEPFRSLGASTLTLLGTTHTDHEPFVDIKLPGFQFIQDDVEYTKRTWHSTQDLYERAQPEDLKQAATIMASFAYHAAMRDEKFPRK